MKIKLYEASILYKDIEKLFKEELEGEEKKEKEKKERKFKSLRTKYRIGNLYLALEKEYEVLEKFKNELIINLGELVDKDKGYYQVKEGNLQEFKTKYKELAETEVNNDYEIEQELFDLILEENVDLSLIGLKILETLIKKKE